MWQYVILLLNLGALKQSSADLLSPQYLVLITFDHSKDPTEPRSEKYWGNFLIINLSDEKNYNYLFTDPLSNSDSPPTLTFNKSLSLSFSFPYELYNELWHEAHDIYNQIYRPFIRPRNIYYIGFSNIFQEFLLSSLEETEEKTNNFGLEKGLSSVLLPIELLNNDDADYKLEFETEKEFEILTFKESIKMKLRAIINEYSKEVELLVKPSVESEQYFFFQYRTRKERKDEKSGYEFLDKIFTKFEELLKIKEITILEESEVPIIKKTADWKVYAVWVGISVCVGLSLILGLTLIILWKRSKNK